MQERKRIADLDSLCAEIRQRIRLGARRVTDDLLATFPQIADNEEAVLTLLFTEFDSLRQRQDGQDWSEWIASYPRWQQRLERVRQVDELLNDSTDAVAGRSSRGTESELLGKSQLRPQGAPDPTFDLTSIEGYELREVVGHGGMGIVYRARHIALDREVAIKVLRQRIDSETERESAMQEARLVARLRHPSIVQIHDVGVSDGHVYLVFEYLPNGTLSEWIAQRAGPVTASDEQYIVHVMMRLAEALHYAHSRGVVHRDLKPANVLLDADGCPRITDFGLGSRINSSAMGDSSPTLRGTPCYIAPEQIGGPSEARATAADIYGLGTILYEMLTGQAPFSGDSLVDVIRQVRSGELRRPTTFGGTVSADLEAVCLKCMDVDPANRYASGLALLADLSRLENRTMTCPDKSPRPTQSSPTIVPRSKHRRRWPRGLVLAGVVLAIAAAIPIAGRPLHVPAEPSSRERPTSTELEMMTVHEPSPDRETPDGSDERGQKKQRADALLDQTQMVQDPLGSRRIVQQSLEEALQVYRELLSDTPSSIEYRRQVASISCRLAQCQVDAGQFADALRTVQRLNQSLGSESDLDRTMAICTYRIRLLAAKAHRLRGETAQAHHLAHQALRTVADVDLPPSLIAASYFERAQCELAKGNELAAADSLIQAILTLSGTPSPASGKTKPTASTADGHRGAKISTQFVRSGRFPPRLSGSQLLQNTSLDAAAIPRTGFRFDTRALRSLIALRAAKEADGYATLAMICFNRGDLESAVHFNRLAASQLPPAKQLESTDVVAVAWLHYLAAKALIDLRENSATDAEATFRQGNTIGADLIARYAHHFDTVDAYLEYQTAIVRFWLNRGDMRSAKEVLRGTAKHLDTLMRHDSHLAKAFLGKTADLHWQLARLHAEMGEYRHAMSDLITVILLHRTQRHNETTSPRLWLRDCFALQELADLAEKTGEQAMATTARKQAKELFDRVVQSP